MLQRPKKFLVVRNMRTYTIIEFATQTWDEKLRRNFRRRFLWYLLR